MAKGMERERESCSLVNVRAADGSRNCCPGAWNVHSKDSGNRRVCHFLRDTDAEERAARPCLSRAEAVSTEAREKRLPGTRRGILLISAGAGG